MWVACAWVVAEGNAQKIFVWVKRSSIRHYCQHTFISHRPKKEKATSHSLQQATRPQQPTQHPRSSSHSSLHRCCIRAVAVHSVLLRPDAGQTLLLLAENHSLVLPATQGINPAQVCHSEQSVVELRDIIQSTSPERVFCSAGDCSSACKVNVG